MQASGLVGVPQSSISDGTATQGLRQLKTGEIGVSEVHLPQYEGTYRKGRFSAANQAGIALSAAFATTYTGIVLYNPNGSGVNLVLEEIGLAEIIAQTSALAFGIMVGQSTTAFSGVTALTPRSNNVGSGVNPVGLVASAATLPVAPTLQKILGSLGTGAVTVDDVQGSNFQLRGGILLAPGAFAALYASAASVAASLIASVEWEEVPV